MKVIGVISGKGGAGKTTVAANLGAALNSEFKKSVLLIDCNITTPNLGLHFGIYSSSVSLEDVLKKRVPVTRAVQMHRSGVRLIPAPLAPNMRPSDLQELKGLFKELDYNLILIDSCPGLGEEIAHTLELCDEVLIVTNPELPAVADALRTAKTARKNNILVAGVVLNRVKGEKQELSVSEVESVIEAPIVAVIPEDVNVRRGIASGNPVVLGSSNSPAALEFKRLAASIVRERYGIGFFAKLRNFFRLRKPEVEIEEAAKKEALAKVSEKKAVIEKVAEEKLAVPQVEVLKVSEEKIEEKPAPPLAPIPVVVKKDAVANLTARKGVTQSLLDKITEKYEKGLIDRATYDKLRGIYEKELEKLEAEIEKMRQ